MQKKPYRHYETQEETSPTDTPTFSPPFGSMKVPSSIVKPVNNACPYLKGTEIISNGYCTKWLLMDSLLAERREADDINLSEALI